VRSERGEEPARGRDLDEVERRKGEHLDIAAHEDVETKIGPGWGDIHLVHEALPRTDLAEVDLSVDFLGRGLRAPLVIAAMTGGHAMAAEVNRALARAAERHGLAMGVGSQRAALRKPELVHTYAVAREAAPTAFLIANIGAAQLVAQASGAAIGEPELLAAIEMIRADALAIHLNFLEESVQTEGDRRASGVREAIAQAIACSPVPVIAKETGAGIGQKTALELAALGFSALDVGGRGGTSFAAVEAVRSRSKGDLRGMRMGEVFRDWGMPTVVSIRAAVTAGVPIIATGGVRSGLDAAKALALGATAVGVARPLLTAALEGDDAVDAWIAQFLDELRVATFLTGCASIVELRSVPRVITGESRRWLDDLGYSTGSSVSS